MSVYCIHSDIDQVLFITLSLTEGIITTVCVNSIYIGWCNGAEHPCWLVLCVICTYTYN